MEAGRIVLFNFLYSNSSSMQCRNNNDNHNNNCSDSGHYFIYLIFMHGAVFAFFQIYDPFANCKELFC